MDLAAYLSYCFVMRFTPGPNNLMSLAQSRERTFRGALPFLLGLHVSLFSMCTVIYLFIHALEDILPLMDLPLRILGALYLVYLTVRLFMKNGGKKTKTIDSKRLFFSALLLNWTNVKVALFMMVGYTSFLLPGGGGPVWTFLLGIAMVASPGAPGGSIMTALPFLWMIFGKQLGDPNGPICALMVALYITQDSFGTACNVSGDNAIAVVIDKVYKTWIEK